MENNNEKLTFQNVIPELLDDLLEKIKSAFGLKGNIRLQYMYKHFDKEYINLTSTSEPQDLGTVKVVEQHTNSPLTSTPIEIASHSASHGSDNCISIASDDTLIFPSSESVLSRTEQWPNDFPIPCFSYDSEIQLERAHSECQVSQTTLTVRFKLKYEILNKLSKEIFKYKAYPEEEDCRFQRL